MAGSVLVERQGAYAFLRLHNPTARNAITTSMWEEITQACSELSHEDVRILVLASNEPGVFSAGADLGDLENALEDHGAFESIVTQAHNSVLHFPAPVIALVDGPCIGGGLALTLDADFRIASDRSVFGIPAARLGLAYPALETSTLVATVGLQAARRFLLSAENLTATAAREVGLIDEVAGIDQLHDVLDELTGRLLKLAPLALRANRIGILSCALASEVVLPENLRDRCWDSADLQEGINAFKGRRTASFENR